MYLGIIQVLRSNKYYSIVVCQSYIHTCKKEETQKTRVHSTYKHCVNALVYLIPNEIWMKVLNESSRYLEKTKN